MSARAPQRSSIVVQQENEQGAEGQEAPVIEFPCDYAIRIVGNNDVEFERDMLDIVERFSPELDRSRVTHRDSRSGKYRSLHVTLWATGEAQLNELFEALKATGRVQMVL
ncbi:HP0495 family protein [Kushneria aurantia]|uniref:UPF0250 protein ACFFHW_07810 n=1 Tax=Kushneria aurantia TaxID=504092 RepID=A0ABV6G2L5_9GAMM|nr:DUF493 domain-containing protein [Kushneria aurantia]